MRTTRPYDKDAPFQSISHASRTTGLSQYWLRKGCRTGIVPHVMSGPCYMINVPELLKQLGGGLGK